MPTAAPLKTVEQIAAQTGLYPPEAFVFVQQSLSLVAERTHGARARRASRHVSGQQLAQGLREIALERWGLMAGLVRAGARTVHATARNDTRRDPAGSKWPRSSTSLARFGPRWTRT